LYYPACGLLRSRAWRRNGSRRRRAFAVATDVSDATAVEELGARAWSEFGSIDTWVNKPGLSIYGNRDHVDEGSLERPQADGRAWALHKGHVVRSSAYTTATLSPMLKTMAFAVAGLRLAAGVKRWRTAA
jgi:NAD(P)-dependent dehydrogenase (short-subunit alcohol dehydrogenase family)